MIEVKQLSFRYPRAERPAVRELSFSVAPGEIFGFLGPSGAGKSTVQKILIRLLADFTGTVQVRGRPVAAWGAEFYERIGVAFEFPNHFSKLTARENLDYFGGLFQTAVLDPSTLLERVGLSEAAEQRVGTFSKGMKTRLGVARALLNDPELLFLDEPTAGLDPVNARAVKTLIREQKDQGKTVFLTTHDMTVADELCDRVAFIVDGEIRELDEPRRLKLSHGQPSVRVEYRREGQLLAAEYLLDAVGANEEFLALIRSEGLETIHSQEATLEEVFVQLTGRTLR